MASEDDRFYEVVATELQNQQMKPGLWAKAYSTTEGDEARTLATYIQLRVQQLVDDEKRLVVLERRLHQEKYRLDVELKHRDFPMMLADVTKVGRVREMLRWFKVIGIIVLIATLVVGGIIFYLLNKG
ncbi:MAG: hypothetical protein ABI443_05785 [Chthoniobacterales bacterium]